VLLVGSLYTHDMFLKLTTYVLAPHTETSIALVPLKNPYALSVGDAFEVLFLKEGRPVANQLVYASYEGYHRHDAEGGHVEGVETRTDEAGVARFELVHAGRWYVRLIHMVEADEEVNYDSNWTTLTFEIRSR
jgi:uncharacterized GH25 family protein